jgi:hypothetical protein
MAQDDPIPELEEDDRDVADDEGMDDEEWEDDDEELDEVNEEE